MREKTQTNLTAEMQFGPTVNIEQAKYLAREFARSRRRGEISLACWGDPGLGKTSIFRQVAQELGIEYRRYNMSTIDYLQLSGIPELVPGTEGNKRAVRYPIIDIPSKGEGILCLDDFTHAMPAVQNIALDLALERSLNDARLGDGWMLVICANHEGGVHTMHPPIANRLRHIFVRAEYAPWRKWAIASGVRDEVISYLDANPENIYRAPEKQEKAFPTPRSWEAMSRALDMIWGIEVETPVERETLDESGNVVRVQQKVLERSVERQDLRDADTSMLLMVVGSAVGPAIGSDFVAFLKTYNLVDFKKIMDGTHPKLGTLVKGEYGDAQRQALELSVVGQARGWWNTKGKTSKARAETLGHILGYLSPNFQALLIRDMSCTDSSRVNALLGEIRRKPDLRWVESIFVNLGSIMAGA